MDAYYEMKKRQGYIFTLHDIDPSCPYNAIDLRTGNLIETPGLLSYWSPLSGRYRNSFEQKAYIEAGCVDVKLPQRQVMRND